MNPSLSVLDNIIIAGDSWGCGEWSTSGNGQPGRVLHKGLEQYFIDVGKQVYNCATGGFSNTNSIDALREALLTQPPSTVFWIQSDPIRDLRPFWRLPESETPYKNLTEEIAKHNGFESLCRSLISKHYQALNELGVEIHLIGGKRDIDVDLLEGLNNLKPTVPSWTHLLVGHIEKYQNLFPVSTMSDYTVANIDLESYNIELRHRVVDEMHRASLCWGIYDEQMIFHPDGQHPNREGHRVLFDYIVKELNL